MSSFLKDVGIVSSKTTLISAVSNSTAIEISEESLSTFLSSTVIVVSFKNASTAFNTVDLPTSFLPTIQVKSLNNISVGSLIPRKLDIIIFLYA